MELDKVWYEYAFLDGGLTHTRKGQVFPAASADVCDLRDAIWTKCKAFLQQCQGIYDSDSLDLWLGEGKRLQLTAKLKDVFKDFQPDEKKVHFTKVEAKTWVEPFEFKPESEKTVTKKKRIEEPGAIDALNSTIFTPSSLFKDKIAMRTIQEKVMTLYRAVDGDGGC